MKRPARAHANGVAAAVGLRLTAPLSLWGGLDVETGRVIDRAHADLGACVSGRVLVMPGGRGSSSSSAVLAEALRLGTGPVAIVLGSPDPILTVGALVAERLYDVRCPIVVCDLDGLESGMTLRVDAQEGPAATVEAIP